MFDCLADSARPGEGAGALAFGGSRLAADEAENEASIPNGAEGGDAVAGVWVIGDSRAAPGKNCEAGDGEKAGAAACTGEPAALLLVLLVLLQDSCASGGPEEALIPYSGALAWTCASLLPALLLPCLHAVFLPPMSWPVWRVWACTPCPSMVPLRPSPKHTTPPSSARMHRPLPPASPEQPLVASAPLPCLSSSSTSASFMLLTGVLPCFSSSSDLASFLSLTGVLPCLSSLVNPSLLACPHSLQSVVKLIPGPPEQRITYKVLLCACRIMLINPAYKHTWVCLRLCGTTSPISAVPL